MKNGRIFKSSRSHGKQLFSFLLLGIAVGALAGCATSRNPPRTVSHVDLNRYMGNWYVIANIPYVLERGKVATYDTYSMRPDGSINNTFTFRKGTFEAPEKSWHGIATVVNHDSNAEWKVRFIWPLSSTYLVLELDPDYKWAVVGTPDKKLLWILGRERQITPQTYSQILDRIQAQGYDPKLLIQVPQPAGS